MRIVLSHKLTIDMVGYEKSDIFLSHMINYFNYTKLTNIIKSIQYEFKIPKIKSQNSNFYKLIFQHI